jgi:plastocyanin
MAGVHLNFRRIALVTRTEPIRDQGSRDMSRARRVRLILAVIAAAVAIAAFFATLSIASGPTVRIKGSSIATYHFKPKAVTVKKGTTVHWKWDSNAPHNVFFSAKKHSSTGKSGTYKRTFKKAGTYRYVCTIHGFHGKVVVQ